jgi:hypothetical protein
MQKIPLIKYYLSFENRNQTYELNMPDIDMTIEVKLNNQKISKISN